MTAPLSPLDDVAALSRGRDRTSRWLGVDVTAWPPIQ
jgi:hypothetical protein